MTSSGAKLPPLQPGTPEYPGHDFEWITEADMHPGDVVLSRGQDPASDLVARLDNGIYSHSAVWTGERIVEAIPQGVLARSLQDTLDEQAYVDVYRWKRYDGEPAGEMGDSNYPARPVIDTALGLADKHMGYGFDELVMGAIIFGSMRKLPEDEDLRIAVRVLAGYLDRVLHKAFVDKTGKEGMVCSQVVSTSFWEATDDHRYAIWVVLDGGLTAGEPAALARAADPGSGEGSSAEDAELMRAQASVRASLDRILGSQNLEGSTPASSRVGSTAAAPTPAPGAALRPTPAGGDLVPTGLVSIRHLQHSPSLELVGRISAKPLNQFPSLKDDLELAIKELLEMEAKSLVSKWAKRFVQKLRPLGSMASRTWEKLKGFFGRKR